MKPRVRSLLNQLEKTSHLFWNVSPETGLFLNQLIRATNPRNVLEIGTSNGYSAIWMAEALAHSPAQNPQTSDTHHAHLYTIESHKRLRYPEAQKNIRKAGLAEHITLILGHAPEAIPKKPRKFDLIFLDATKYEHTDYLKAILPRTRKGSIIITDNALSHKKELAPYRKTLFGLRNKNMETHLLPLGTGLLISTRIQ